MAQKSGTLHSSRSLIGKNPEGLGQVTILEIELNRVFQSMNSETFIPTQYGMRMECKEELHAIEKQQSVGVDEPLPGGKHPALDGNRLL